MIKFGSAIIALLAARGAVSVIILTVFYVFGEENFSGLIWNSWTSAKIFTASKYTLVVIIAIPIYYICLIGKSKISSVPIALLAGRGVYALPTLPGEFVKLFVTDENISQWRATLEKLSDFNTSTEGVFTVIGVVCAICIWVLLELIRRNVKKGTRERGGYATYETDIKRLTGQLLLWAIPYIVLLGAVRWSYTKDGYTEFSLSRLTNSGGVIGIALLILSFLCVCFLFAVLENLHALLKTLRFQAIAIEHSHKKHRLVANAYDNVRPLLTSPFEGSWRPGILKKMFKKYDRHDKLSTAQLKDILANKGFFTPHILGYNTGTTLDEAVMLAIYSSRESKETVEKETAERKVEAAQFEGEIAPNPQRRSEIERQIAALQAELAGNVSASGGNQSKGSPRRPKEAKIKTGLEDDD